jgi:hypothetical protein
MIGSGAQSQRDGLAAGRLCGSQPDDPNPRITAGGLVMLEATGLREWTGTDRWRFSPAVVLCSCKLASMPRGLALPWKT